MNCMAKRIQIHRALSGGGVLLRCATHFFVFFSGGKSNRLPKIWARVVIESQNGRHDSVCKNIHLSIRKEIKRYISFILFSYLNLHTR
jgi:hypothetical protein